MSLGESHVPPILIGMWTSDMPVSATAATVVAGGTAAAAYLDAKLHLRKDIAVLWRLKRAEWESAANGKG